MTQKHPTAGQLDLSIVPPRLNAFASSSDLVEQFALFHCANPAVYRLIRSIAYDLKRRGFKRAGMKAIFEQLRWQFALHTSGDDYKLNNNFPAFYARLLEFREPQLKGFFRTRGQRVTFDPSKVQP